MEDEFLTAMENLRKAVNDDARMTEIASIMLGTIHTHMATVSKLMATMSELMTEAADEVAKKQAEIGRGGVNPPGDKDRFN